MTSRPDAQFLFDNEDLMHEIASLSDALTKVTESATANRNTISFLSYELNDRVEKLKEAWLEAVDAIPEQAATDQALAA